MKVVVVCNCYKREAFTRLCLPLALDHAGIEADWLLVDDGSGDGTAGFLQGLGEKCQSVTVRCHAENRGHYVLRNEGFEYALGQDADAVVNIDNDILFPQNWLRDLTTAFLPSPFGVGTAWVVNDKTLRRMIEGALDKTLDQVDLNRWVDTKGCGGGSIIHRRKVLETGCRYDEKKVLFTYGDADFNRRVRQAGFSVGVYLGVQCWHLQSIIWPDDKYEEWKRRLRHKHRHGAVTGLESAIERDKAKTIAGVLADATANS